MGAAKFWDKQAKKYARSKIGDQDSYRKGLDRTLSYLAADMTVLEFGCGTGMTAQTLAPHVRSYLATDVSGGMILECENRQTAHKVAGLTFRQATLADVSGSFDAVLGFNILHLIPDVDGALKDVHRLLEPGGLFISKTTCQPAGFNLKFAAMMTLGRVISLFNRGLFFRLETVAELDARIKAAGFEIIETGCFPVDPPARFVVARKIQGR